MKIENARIVIWEEFFDAEPEVLTFDGQSVEVAGAVFHKTVGSQGDVQRSRQGGEIKWIDGADLSPESLDGKSVKVIDQNGATVFEGLVSRVGMPSATPSGDLIIPTA